MFNDTFNDARKILGIIQNDAEPIAIQLNETNPATGGPGMSPSEIHAATGFLVAAMHNLAMAVGNIVDTLEEHLNATADSAPNEH